MSEHANKLRIFFNNDPVVGLPAGTNLQQKDKIELKGAPVMLKQCYPLTDTAHVQIVPAVLASSGSVEMGLTADGRGLMECVKAEGSDEYQVQNNQAVSYSIRQHGERSMRAVMIQWDSVSQKFIAIVECLDLWFVRRIIVFAIDTVSSIPEQPNYRPQTILWTFSANWPWGGDTDRAVTLDRLVTRDGVSHLFSSNSASNTTLNLSTGVLSNRATPLPASQTCSVAHDGTIFGFGNAGQKGLSKFDPLTGEQTVIDANIDLRYGRICAISASQVLVVSDGVYGTTAQKLSLYVDGVLSSQMDLGLTEEVASGSAPVGGNMVLLPIAGATQSGKVVSVAGGQLSVVRDVSWPGECRFSCLHTAGAIPFAVVGTDYLVDSTSGAMRCNVDTMFWTGPVAQPQLSLDGLYPAFFMPSDMSHGREPKHISVLVSLAEGGKYDGKMLPKNYTIQMSEFLNNGAQKWQQNAYVVSGRYNISLLTSSCVLSASPTSKLFELTLIPDMGKN